TAARHDWIAQEGRQQREVRGQYQRTADLRVSTTDPDTTPMRLKGGGTHLGYQTHYVVDGGRRRIILGVLVTPGEVTENHPMLALVWRARCRWKLRPRQVTGDTKYGTGENIQVLEQMGIRAYVPLPDWEQAATQLACLFAVICAPLHWSVAAEPRQGWAALATNRISMAA